LLNLNFKPMKKSLITQSFFLALGEGAYIALVALFMRNINKILGQGPEILAMAAFLILLVLSAALSGALILGKPALLYFDNKKKEALKLFAMTLGWMFVFLVIMLSVLAIF
jgi:hypothetical protein